MQVAQGDDEYGGEKPFSEPESRIVKLVADGAQLRSYVNLHAGEWALYTPWDSQKNAPPGLPVSMPACLVTLMLTSHVLQSQTKCWNLLPTCSAQPS